MVKSIDGNQLRAAWRAARGNVEGRIDRAAVVPFDRALEIFTEEIKRNPTVRSYMLRASLWDEKSDYDKAIADYNAAVRINSREAYAAGVRNVSWFGKLQCDSAIVRAYRLQQKHQYARAISEYDLAIWFNPKFALAYTRRASAWQGWNEHDRAIADFDEAIRLDPKDAIAFYYRATSWRAKGDSGLALADCSEAIRLNPKYALAYRGRGVLRGTGPPWSGDRRFQRRDSARSQNLLKLL